MTTSYADGGKEVHSLSPPDARGAAPAIQWWMSMSRVSLPRSSAVRVRSAMAVR